MATPTAHIQEGRRMKRVLPFLALLFGVLLAGCAGMMTEAAQREEARARLAKADAMFQERCKKAGEFIHRTAENVDGIFLLKIREGTNFRDQYRMDDPYGHDSTGDDYIKGFFYGRDEKGHLIANGPVTSLGFRYVDAIDPKDGKRYRYMGSIQEVTHTSSLLIGGDGKTKFKTLDFVLDRIPAPDPAPRYGVTYDDISTREERDDWIAGSSLKVIDLRTNELMAERIGYMMDRGQGNTSGGRAPWLLAADNACPSFFRNPNLPPNGHGSRAQSRQAQDFVEKTLKPRLEK